MSFVAGRSQAVAGAGNVTLPSITDLGGAQRSFTLYSHGLVTAGAGVVSVGFDGGSAVLSVPANGTVAFAIPPTASVMNLGAAATVALGKMD